MYSFALLCHSNFLQLQVGVCISVCFEEKDGKTKECYKDFKVEKDPFRLEQDSAEGVEERWFKLGAILVNENSAKR